MGRIERVEYILELAQWMGSNAIPSVDITTVLQTGLDAVYEIEEQNLTIDTTSSSSGMGVEENNNSEIGMNITGKKQTARNKSTTTINNSNSTSNTARSNSTAKIGIKLDAYGKPIIEEKLPMFLNYKLLEQSSRLLIMQSLLECKQLKQIELYMEAIYFIQKSLNLWLDTLYLIYKKKEYLALSPEERGESSSTSSDSVDVVATKGNKAVVPSKQSTAVVDNTTNIEKTIYPTLDSYNPPRPAYLCPPTEPLLFLTWLAQPSTEFTALMLLAQTEYSIDIPSAMSLNTIQLSIHYWLLLAEGLHSVGYSMQALYVYSYIRMVLLYIQPNVNNTVVVLCCIHYHCYSILLELGMSEIIDMLPQYLPAINNTTSSSSGSSTNSSSTNGILYILYKYYYTYYYTLYTCMYILYNIYFYYINTNTFFLFFFIVY